MYACKSFANHSRTILFHTTQHPQYDTPYLSRTLQKMQYYKYHACITNSPRRPQAAAAYWDSQCDWDQVVPCTLPLHTLRGGCRWQRTPLALVKPLLQQRITPLALLASATTFSLVNCGNWIRITKKMQLKNHFLASGGTCGYVHTHNSLLILGMSVHIWIHTLGDLVHKPPNLLHFINEKMFGAVQILRDVLMIALSQ